MSTFMQKKESVVRKWYILDAANKPLGKTAVAAADLLRGLPRKAVFLPRCFYSRFSIENCSRRRISPIASRSSARAERYP